jgi:hypothetical protein
MIISAPRIVARTGTGRPDPDYIGSPGRCPRKTRAASKKRGLRRRPVEGRDASVVRFAFRGVPSPATRAQRARRWLDTTFGGFHP